MHTDNSSTTLTKLGIVLSALILALVPFHAFLTVWGASFVGHYTLLRLWSLGLLLLLAICIVALCIKDRAGAGRIFRTPIIRLISAYLLVQLIWGFVALSRHDVDGRALSYGLFVNSRYLLFFAFVWLLATKSSWLSKHSFKLVLIPATIVILFGLAQYLLLPIDFLKHFGYTPSTIYPYETINHNIHYLRIASTLRGANPLGAYLIVVLSLLLTRIVRYKQHRAVLTLLGLGGLLALTFSFSRSAWIGFILSAGIILITSFYKREHSRHWLIAAGVAVVVVIAGGIIFLRHNTTFQDAFLHTDTSSTIKTTSNEAHVSALKSGIRDMLHEPFGRGPGTAGPASVYNNHPARIAEDYFVQVGQETGWIGFILFIAITLEVGRLLWARRTDPLAFGLLAALVGICFVNLLSHAWEDDTLAFLWWGLTGIAMATRVKATKRS